MTRPNFLVEALSLPGPILITGAGGFVGSHLYKALVGVRSDVFGTTRSGDSWRLNALGVSSPIQIDLTDKVQFLALLNRIKPKTVLIFSALPNQLFKSQLLKLLTKFGL